MAPIALPVALARGDVAKGVVVLMVERGLIGRGGGVVL